MPSPLLMFISGLATGALLGPAILLFAQQRQGPAVRLRYHASRPDHILSPLSHIEVQVEVLGCAPYRWNAVLSEGGFWFIPSPACANIEGLSASDGTDDVILKVTRLNSTP